MSCREWCWSISTSKGDPSTTPVYPTSVGARIRRRLSNFPEAMLRKDSEEFLAAAGGRVFDGVEDGFLAPCAGRPIGATLQQPPDHRGVAEDAAACGGLPVMGDVALASAPWFKSTSTISTNPRPAASISADSRTRSPRWRQRRAGPGTARRPKQSRSSGPGDDALCCDPPELSTSSRRRTFDGRLQ